MEPEFDILAVKDFGAWVGLKESAAGDNCEEQETLNS